MARCKTYEIQGSDPAKTAGADVQSWTRLFYALEEFDDLGGLDNIAAIRRRQSWLSLNLSVRASEATDLLSAATRAVEIFRGAAEGVGMPGLPLARVDVMTDTEAQRVMTLPVPSPRDL